MILTLILAYLLGSIPSAIWISKTFYKKDIRNYGSKNPGSTNMYRVFGFWAGFTTQIIDITKGFLAIYLAKSFHPQITTPWLLLHGLLAVVGHIYPIFAKFKGGKGVNTILGVMLAIHPIAAAVGIVVFVIVLLLFRYVSLASMIAVNSFPFYLIIESQIRRQPIDLWLFAVGILLGIGVIYTHRSNIQRLLNGTENKVRFKKT